MSKRSRGSIRRRSVAAAGVAALAGLFVVATAIPAFAHTATAGGSTVCSDGAQVITWTIKSSDTTLPMHVDSATATLNGTDAFPVTGAVGMDIPENHTITATTTIPGTETGTVVLNVSGSWSDDHFATATATVTLLSQCTPSTTATTSTTEATTTTTVETPTSTTGPTTSTTVDSETTVPSSTTTPSTPITGEGSTVVSTPTTVVTGGQGSTPTSPPSDVTAAGSPTGSGNLPFTGSTDSGPIVGLTSLVGGAFALVFARRRRSNP